MGLKRKVKVVDLSAGRVSIRALNMIDLVEIGMERFMKIAREAAEGEVKDVTTAAKLIKDVVLRAVIDPPMSDNPADENSIYALSNDDLLKLFNEIVNLSGLAGGEVKNP